MAAASEYGLKARRRLLEMIDQEVAQTARWLGISRLDESVRSAIGQVPRHEFVPSPQVLFAYQNRPLPIGHGQTISQPYMVAVMSQLAAIGPGTRVLEIGTGCGYQAAVLAELGGRVTSVELVPELAEAAAKRLAKLGYETITVHQGDGSLGWPEAAPYDAIVVTAAAFHRVPPALVEQLAPGGRLVIPLESGQRGGHLLRPRPEQELLLITKDRRSKTKTRTILPVAFVPLIETEGKK